MLHKLLRRPLFWNLALLGLILPVFVFLRAVWAEGPSAPIPPQEARKAKTESTNLTSASEKSTDKLDFSRDVRPILTDHCFACHGPDLSKRKGDLRLDVREDAVKHGALVPGKPDQSEFLQRLTHADPRKRMPPAKTGRSLTAAQVATLRRWIEEGAVYQGHWAFLPPRRPLVPALAQTDPQTHWPQNPIDQFVLARLQKEGLHPVPEAERFALLRRVTLDLTGLPPSLEEVDAFLADTRPGAYERVVDRLLASARFGEHLTRYWLDMARYGDTHGLHLDNFREIWLYREWVLRAFNTNKPYDQFLVEQLAGDLLPNATLDQRIATGFNRNHITTSEGGSIPDELYVRNVVDRVDTTGIVFFGLTFGCARCHDHKFDPISMRDYYSLFAFFNSLDANPLDGNAARHPPVLKVPTAEQRRQLEELEQRRTQLQEQVKKETKKEIKKEIPKKGQPKKEVPASSPFQQQLKEVESKIQALEGQMPATLVSVELATPRPAFLLKRGEYDQKGEKVERKTPAFLPPFGKDLPMNRLGLARWLLQPEQPLTARVAVNRFWQHLFGVGLVRTSEDLGLQGELPSHPELFDWLATEFQESGWDIKQLVRLMVTSATYRQSTKVSAELYQRDPQNRLLARGPRFRLDAEMLRDQVLAVSGLLVEQLGGPSVKPPQPPGVWSAVAYVGSNTGKFSADKGSDKVHRRSMYSFWKRTAPPPQMAILDAPSREACVTRRERTNTPLQALLLLNDPQFIEAARVLAERALTEEGGEERRVNWLFRRATQRHPDRTELAELTAALADLRAEYRDDVEAARRLISVGETKPDPRHAPAELAAWTMLANTVLNLAEVLNK